MKTYYKQKDEIFDLEAIFGNEWAEITVSKVGIVLPGCRRTFPPAELRSVFFRLQLITLLEHDNRRLRAERETAYNAQKDAENRSEWYHSQLRLESHYGAIVQACFS